ncbi:cation:proton antiporter [Galbibacter sp. EGI 63066]|uniref:cation:proton antiporter n=1 Tax=Galbibacter sp. EGI 63066 TaxID=2993559 RepID=UPI0022490E27|nr:cation:proton antiporter [Galbibacter sp. EGI 63066]MCX2679035.1 cation:proton antiporter [Galbibacter sp. EGI 63066]
MEGFDILSLLIILVAAWAGGALFKRIGYPAIMGELLVGILIGPALLGLLESSETINILSETGIIMLMAYIGMEIHFKDLGKASWAGLLAAVGGFVVPFALGYYVISATGGTPLAGFFVGIAVGVTSLATKSRILVDLNLLDTRIAYVLMAGALISDSFALIIFAGISSFIDAGSVNTSEIAIVAGKVLLFFAVTSALGLFVLPKLGKLLTNNKIKNRTFHFTLLLIIVFGFAELAEMAGLHSILGAFMAGLFVKDNVFDRQVTKDITGIFHDVSIGFMAPIFFVSAGFHVTLDVFQTDLNLMLLILGVAFAGKILGTVLFYLPSGNGWREGLAVGTGMNGRGAVEIIIAGIGLQYGIISQELFSILVFMAILTTLSVPLLLTWTTNWLKKRGELVKQYSKEGYLILGANPLALFIAKHLGEKNKVRLIDTNKVAVIQARKLGFECIHGNALDESIQGEAEAGNFKAFIALTGNSEINLLASRIANDVFYVPEKYVVIAANQDGVGVNLLHSISASTLFAGTANIEPWIRKIQNDEYDQKTEIVNNKISTRNWLKEKKKNGNPVLPLIIMDGENNKRPFHYDDVIDSLEKVIYIE